MSDSPQKITLGTRGSALARWQTDYVSQLLRDAWPKLDIRVQIVTTQGDRVLDTPLPLLGGKGVFTAELEADLHDGKVDYAVHSLKDLPTENPVGLTIGATPLRSSANDVLISKHSYTLATLPQGATVGTSSRRRAAQLLHKRRDLKIVDIRGNVDTRIRKALDPEGVYDAIVLAAAGLERLGQKQVISDVLSLEDMMPAPGQGALAVQCRDENVSRTLLRPINHAKTEIEVTAERAFLGGLGGGCALPIAAYATIEDDRLHLQGRVTALDGSKQVDVSLDGTANIEAARKLGHELAPNSFGTGCCETLGDCEVSALAGKRIVITRASHQADELEQLLLDRDAIPLLYPCIAIKPPQDSEHLNHVLQAALDGAFDWLALTSSNTVRALKQSFDAMGVRSPYPLKLQVAAVGSKTAQYAEEQLGVRVNIVPEQYSASALANALPLLKNARVLLPQSEIAEPDLATTLSDTGAIVTSVTAYQTVIGSGGIDLPALLKHGQVDAITFTSTSTVNNLLQRLQNEGGDSGLLAELCIACIGTSTGGAARQNHLPVTVMPNQHTLEDLVTALEHYYAELAIGESD